MCLSSHEMSSEQIEYEIEECKRYIDSGRYSDKITTMWSRRIDSLTKILKERAENGTY